MKQRFTGGFATMRWIHRLLSRRIRSSMLSGLVAAFLTLMICAMTVNLALYLLDFPMWLFKLTIYLCHVPAIFIGTVHTVLRRKKRPFFNGIRISTAYAFLIWIASYLAGDKPFQWSSILLIALAIGIGVASGSWAHNKRTRR